jgi:hypothetical protein
VSTGSEAMVLASLSSPGLKYDFSASTSLREMLSTCSPKSISRRL